MLRADPRGRIVIDGRSGAGKTTLAHRIAAVVGVRVVSLDEFYPGWDGLAEATHITERIVTSHAAGRIATYRRWDWERDVWLPQEHAVQPDAALVIEGCGALSRTTAEPATLSIWIDGDETARRERALRRDGDGFRKHWDAWAAQEKAHIRAHDPQGLAAYTAVMI